MCFYSYCTIFTMDRSQLFYDENSIFGTFCLAPLHSNSFNLTNQNSAYLPPYLWLPIASYNKCIWGTNVQFYTVSVNISVHKWCMLIMVHGYCTWCIQAYINSLNLILRNKTSNICMFFYISPRPPTLFFLCQCIFFYI